MILPTRLLHLATVAALLATATFLRADKVAEASREFGGATPLQWSVRMADSEVARSGKSLFYTGDQGAKWDYTSGLLAYALLQLDDRLCEPRHQAFAEKLIGSFVQPDGQIHRYQLDNYNIDHVAPGRAILRLYSLTGDERYRKAADLLRTQLRTHPRTTDGGFWHKKRYPSQMWLDGLYMGQPFYSEYALRFNDPAAYDDIAHQIVTVAKHTYDARTGLYYHGWDEAKAQNWANKQTGQSPNFWGRAVGWYAMGIVDTLDCYPANHPRRAEIIAIFNQLAEGVLKHQDPETGLWYQVLDQGGRKGNYLEATCSSMFIYSFAKGVNRGYLPESYIPAIRKAYAGMIARLVNTGADGRTNLNQCCEVAGLSADRDGSYEYYIKERIISNDLKGVGPFILAGIELEKLFKLEPTGWDQAAVILSRIKAPQFPARDFVITAFGAPTDGQGDSTAAIAKAIEACTKAGGGRVVVPAGVFITGAVHLKSNVNLHVAEGATLRFSPDPAKYLPVVLTRWEGAELMSYSPLIYAYGQENIAITGKGTLDGGATPETWLAWNNKKASPTLQVPARKKLFAMSEANTPVAERIFGEGSYLRPSFVQPYRCKNILIEGVTLTQSPMWVLNPVLCTNITVRGVTIVSHGSNNDGCDPESCRDVLIEDTTFDTGDDCIAIKSGRNADGRRLLVPSDNFIIRNSNFKDGHGGVVLGSECSGGIRNIFTENCRMDSPNLDRALRFKNNAVRGGVLENVHMRNVQIGRVAESVLTVDLLYEEGANGRFNAVVRNVTMDNITSTGSPRVVYIRGYEGAVVDDITLSNSTFSGITTTEVMQHAGTITLKNVNIIPAKAAKSANSVPTPTAK